MAKKTKDACIGCRDDFYNGKNNLGVKECWGFKDAVFVMRKEVPLNMRPPWNMPPIKVLNCYHRQGYSYHNPDRTC